MMRAILVGKLPSQSHILIWPRQNRQRPGERRRLRTANIQGFKILQGVLCPSGVGSVIILPNRWLQASITPPNPSGPCYCGRV